MTTRTRRSSTKTPTSTLDVEVRCGDWRDATRGLAAFGAVDHLFADPPFTEHVHANCRSLAKRVSKSRSVDLGFAHFTDDDRDHFCAVAAKFVRRWHVIHTDIESVGRWQDAFEANGIEYVRGGVWVKVGAMPQITGDRPAGGAEAIVFGHTKKANGKPAKKRWNGGGAHAVYRYAAPPASRDRHPTQKPLELLERLILEFTDHGDVIADTHCGSGTTLVAAARRGRRAIGWELQERWVQVASRRLLSTHEQLDFTDASQMHARTDGAQIAIGMGE